MRIAFRKPNLSLPRFRPGFFFACLVLLLTLRGCESAPKRPTPAPLTRLYYTWATGPEGLTHSGITGAELRACGLDAYLVAADSTLAYGWLVQPLTEDGVRASLAPVVTAADGVPAWLALSCVTQGGILAPGIPARTFYDPHNAAHRAMARANLQLIARVAAELGITHLGFDFEAYQWSSLWTWLEVEGGEPTNNAAERALRPAVLWRKSSFGHQSETGEKFIERMLTAVTTLRLQGRNVWQYLVETCVAARQGASAPSLLP